MLRAVLAAGVTPTDKVITGVWRWFQDVEVNVPLPIMPMDDDERASIATAIAEEMDTILAELEAVCAGKSDSEQSDVTENHALVAPLNNLWKELAGCYADLINDEVPILPAALRAMIVESILEELAEKNDCDEAEIRRRVRTDQSLRMMLRMNGINPDEL